MPCPIREDWNHIEALHPLSLELSYAEGTRKAKDKWKKAMKQLRDTPGVDRLRLLSPVHEKVRLINELGGLVLPARKDLTSVVLPSTKLLDSLNPSVG